MNNNIADGFQDVGTNFSDAENIDLNISYNTRQIVNILSGLTSSLEMQVLNNTTVPDGTKLEKGYIIWQNAVTSFGDGVCGTDYCPMVQQINFAQGISGEFGDDFCRCGGCPSLEIVDFAPFKNGSVGINFCGYKGCDWLKSVSFEFENTNGTIGTGFCRQGGCSRLQNIYIGAISQNALSNDLFCADTGCLSLTTLTAPQTRIIGNAFCVNSGCIMLENVENVFEKVTQLGNGFCMYHGCSSIKSINMQSLESFPIETFCAHNGCPQLSRLVLGNSSNITAPRVDSEFCSQTGCSKDLIVTVLEQPVGDDIVTTTENPCVSMLGGQPSDWIYRIVDVPYISTTSCPTSGKIIARSLQDVDPITIETSNPEASSIDEFIANLTVNTYVVNTVSGRIIHDGIGYQIIIEKSSNPIDIGTYSIELSSTYTEGFSLNSKHDFSNYVLDLTACQHQCVRQTDFS